METKPKKRKVWNQAILNSATPFTDIMRAPNNFEIYRWEDVEEAKNETFEEFEELPSRYSNPKIGVWSLLSRLRQNDPV